MQRQFIRGLKGYLNFLKESDFIVLDGGKKRTPFKDSGVEGEEKAKKLKTMLEE